MEVLSGLRRRAGTPRHPLRTTEPGPVVGEKPLNLRLYRYRDDYQPGGSSTQTCLGRAGQQTASNSLTMRAM